MSQTWTPFYVPLTPPHNQCVGLISYDLTTSLFTPMIHTELNLQTLKMRILWAPKHSAKRTTASIGSVFSLNSPQYRFLDHFHMTGCICALRTMGETLFHFGKVCIKGWMKAGRSTGSLIMSGL